MDGNPDGLRFKSNALEITKDALIAAELLLKNAADAKGMNIATPLTDFSSKSMNTLSSEETIALAAHTTARVEWEASVAELERQRATHAINTAWKAAASAAFAVVETDFKGTDKVEEAYAAAVQLTEDKRLL